MGLSGCDVFRGRVTMGAGKSAGDESRPALSPETTY